LAAAAFRHESLGFPSQKSINLYSKNKHSLTERLHYWCSYGVPSLCDPLWYCYGIRPALNLKAGSGNMRVCQPISDTCIRLASFFSSLLPSISSLLPIVPYLPNAALFRYQEAPRSPILCKTNPRSQQRIYNAMAQATAATRAFIHV